jgi:2-C-methyl-D-erythritol 4-phosphate cytidylyltransferase
VPASPQAWVVQLAILILASGRSARMGSSTPKVYLPIGGVPILVRSVRRLAKLADSAEIVLAVHPEDRSKHLDSLLPELTELGVTKVVDGGSSRQESMRRALAAAGHAARPFFPIDATRDAIEAAQATGAALLATPVPDTLKRISDDHTVKATLDRSGVWLAQTPQIIRRDLLEQGLKSGFDATDDVSLVEQLGGQVMIVPGSSRNLKITSPSDLELAELIANLEDQA